MKKIPVKVIKYREHCTIPDFHKKWGGAKNLDIGCGSAKKDGFIGMDIMPFPCVDIVHNLDTAPWPIQDNSIDLVVSSHVIEHVDSVITFMSEIYRVLKKGGRVVIRYPHYSHRNTFRDPTHKRYLTLESLDYFTEGTGLCGMYTDFAFKQISKTISINNEIGYILGKMNINAFEIRWCKLFPAFQVDVELIKP